MIISYGTLLFPGIPRPMMITFVTAFVFIDLFQFIQNSICTGVNGTEDCCFGFSLNRTTRKCEKCANGYIGSYCSQKCIHPTYGEDCQYICHCLETDCHYSYGCLHKTGTISKKPSSTKKYADILLATSTFASLWNKAFSYQYTTEDSSVYLQKISGTTVKNISSNDLLNNDVFVGLFGVFVLFFIVFVVANIYRKFFRQKLVTSQLKESELHAQYQSLNLDGIGTASSVAHAQLIADSSYLSPVFSRNENDNTRELQRHNIGHELNVVSEELALGRQRFIPDSSYAENELNVSLTGRADHVYIEIPENSEENLNPTFAYGRESNILNNNDSRTALDGSVVYMNL